jgi:hypothetical protein
MEKRARKSTPTSCVLADRNSTSFLCALQKLDGQDAIAQVSIHGI